MRYGSVCSGIEAATAAWHPLGWTPAFFSEIEAFPKAVLAHHYPGVPDLGDMTKFQEWPDADIDVLVGGTPCQSFSHAGLRKGLRDPRGNLMLTFGAIAARYRPRWILWENVPGVLSSGDGRDFGTFLGMLGELGYGFAYRVLDAQYFGLAQRRKRVFVVGCLGDWRAAAAVLFESESLRGDPAPRREAGQGTAADAVARTLRNSDGGIDREDGHTLIPGAANTLTARMHKGINTTVDEGQTPIVVDLRNITSPANRSDPQPGAPCHTLHKPAVRRLTPRECERLQGFPDDYTLIPVRGKPAADAPRYRALGNSMAVPVIRWLGERIQMVNEILTP